MRARYNTNMNNTFSLDQLQPGMVVRVRKLSGGTVLRTIDYCHSNIKNGLPGCDLSGPNGEDVFNVGWCYLDQIVSIVRR